MLPGNELACAPRALARKQLLAILPLPTDFVLTLLIAVYRYYNLCTCFYQIRNKIFLFLNNLLGIQHPAFRLAVISGWPGYRANLVSGAYLGIDKLPFVLAWNKREVKEEKAHENSIRIKEEPVRVKMEPRENGHSHKHKEKQRDKEKDRQKEKDKERDKERDRDREKEKKRDKEKEKKKKVKVRKDSNSMIIKTSVDIT